MDLEKLRTWRWRLDGEQQQDSPSERGLHQSRGIPAFSSSFFCYSLERVALFFSTSALSLPDLGTDKGGEGKEGGEGEVKRGGEDYRGGE